MDYARGLIKRYASANLVITSRIHCALPCLAVATPIIYVQAEVLEDIHKRSPGRMDGIINLFNVLEYDKKNDTVKLGNNKEKINFDTQIINSDDYKTFRDRLSETVKKFTGIS